VNGLGKFVIVFSGNKVFDGGKILVIFNVFFILMIECRFMRFFYDIRAFFSRVKSWDSIESALAQSLRFNTRLYEAKLLPTEDKQKLELIKMLKLTRECKNADLTNVDLTEQNLNRVNLQGCNLNGADLSVEEQ
jgi:hypothetical protein